MKAIDKGTVRKALSAHAAIGLLASSLLYIICLTGTLTVFYEEWQRIEQPGAPELAAIGPDQVQAAVAAVLASEKGKPGTTHLYVHLPVEALPRATVTTDHQAVHLDGRGSVAGPEENAWADFLLLLHDTLTLPSTLGLIVVGALGAMMLALSVTGVLAHPRIFRDAFRLRARHDGGVGLADWHNRLGVWTLPFAVAIAFTGATIGLGTLAGYGLASRYYGGDIEKAYAPIFGGEGKADERPAGVPDVATPLRYMARHFPGAAPYYVIIHDPLTAGQHVQIVAAHSRRLIYGETYNFDARGRFHGNAGLSDGSLGQQAAASTYNLHFGNYGGLPVKIVYFVLGLALTAIVATGTYIWLGKRRRRGLNEPRLRRAWSAIVWGTPLALALAFAARMTIGNAAPLTAIFWGGFAVALFAAVLTPKRSARAVVPN